MFEFAHQRRLMTLKLDADVCLIWERRYLLSFSALIYDQVLSHQHELTFMLNARLHDSKSVCR